MAYSPEQWKEAKYLFEIEGKGVREIERLTGISNAQISKKAKKEAWEKEAPKNRLKSDIADFEKKEEEIRKQKEAIGSTLATLDNFEITMLKEDQEITELSKRILMNNVLLNSIRRGEMLSKNTKTIGIKVATYNEDGQRDGEDIKKIEMPLTPRDYKELGEADDKAAITSGIAPRHAPKTEITNTNAQQNNLTAAEISKAVADGLPD